MSGTGKSTPPPKKPGSSKRPPTARGPRTLGPIQDLERHLPPEWWRKLFNSVYLKTDGDVVEDAANTARDVDLLIEATGIEPGDRVLDLCCGQGRHALELARRGYRHVVGIDRSRYLIRLAKRRAAEQGLSVQFHEGDARRFRVPEKGYDCIAVMGNSFGYFEQEEDDMRVLERIGRALKPQGVLALDLAEGDWLAQHYERRSWEWIDEEQFVCRERSLDRQGRRLVSREVVVHAERGVIADQFYAERLFTRESIAELLQRAGFREVRDHASIETQSTRNQDLGMMSRRMFITARAPAHRVPARRPGPLFRKITVLMGDPKLPDTVKRNQQFNPEDHETIARLQAALGELKAYEFEFLNDHDKLIDQLRETRPPFVFNLCDEGFHNDATMELHVPATLEMLGIPYTGAGPACLGMCYNKAVVRAIAASLDIPVPAETFFSPDDQAAMIPSILPALLKPNFGDGSVGITKEAVVHTLEQLLGYLERLRRQMPGTPVLVQEYLTGPEFSVGMIGNPGIRFHALPVLEVDYSDLPPELPRILGYESKWEPDSPYWTRIKYRPAQIDEQQKRLMIDYSCQLFERLGMRDYGRFDFRATADGEVRLLEANPNPGWPWDGKFNLMASFERISYAQMLEMILQAAFDRLAAGGAVPAPTPDSSAAQVG